MVQNGFTVLIMAAANGHDGIVDLLLKAGADATLQGGSPKGTALEWAKHKAHAKCVAILEAAQSTQSTKVEPQMLPSSHVSGFRGGSFASYPS